MGECCSTSAKVRKDYHCSHLWGNTILWLWSRADVSFPMERDFQVRFDCSHCPRWTYQVKHEQTNLCRVTWCGRLSAAIQPHQLQLHSLATVTSHFLLCCRERCTHQSLQTEPLLSVLLRLGQGSDEVIFRKEEHLPLGKVTKDNGGIEGCESCAIHKKY